MKKRPALTVSEKALYGVRLTAREYRMWKRAKGQIARLERRWRKAGWQ